MAITHADVAPSPKRSNLGSKTGAFLMLLSILLALFCFVLCLIADAARSQVTWSHSQCTYTASGKLPLLSATAAFAALAAAMVVQHVFLSVAVTKLEFLAEITWDPDSAFAKTLTCQAGFFFVATWASFAVGEIQLLIGVSVESGHLNNWATPRPSCRVVRRGLFTAAGVLGLATVFFATGLYLTALRAEGYLQVQQNTLRQMLEAAVMYVSPPRSPRADSNNSLPPRSPRADSNNSLRVAPGEGPSLPTQHQHNPPLHYYLTTVDKQSTFV